jgi:hypothetical protein
MGIINDQGVFIGPPLGDDEEAATTSFREDDDFSIELFDESIVLADLPNDIGIAFVKSSDSPADFATLALDGTNTSTIFIDNTAGSANLAISGNLNVSGFIFGKFEDITVSGTTKFGDNTVEIDGDDNSITGVSTITANVGVITAISGITTITPVTELNINGGLVVSGVSTIGIASTSSLTVNSTLSFELISNTNLRILVRGTDGVTRVGIVTLS